jgi:thymidylate synthase
MNKLDKQYTDLLQTILDYGVEKKDRTGTGTKSIFGYTIRHSMKDGFPLLTTKKMYFKGIVTELLWFLRGDTNIKFLVDNDCHIWDGDAYKNYVTNVKRSIDRATADGILQDDSSEEYSYLSKESFIQRIKTDAEFAKKWGDLGPVYGKQWRSWERYGYRGVQNGALDCGIITMDEYKKEKYIDQIANLIQDLKTNPDSRRLMVNAWNVGELDQMVLPPCHYGFQVYTRELSWGERMKILKTIHPLYHMEQQLGGEDILTRNNIPTRAISLMWNQRSVDTFLGLPFNIASYGLLLEIIAKAVNMVPDQLIGNLGDVHLYSNHIEQAREQITREPFPLPTLNINTEWWPYEGGESGEGPLDAVKVFESFKNENFCRCLLEEDIQLYKYQSHPAIKAKISN